QKLTNISVSRSSAIGGRITGACLTRPSMELHPSLTGSRLAIGVLQNHQLMLHGIVTIFLIVRQLGQSDAALLNDLRHELFKIFGVSILLGVIKIERVFDLQDLGPPNDRYVCVS